jgi:hypothetical protein
MLRNILLIKCFGIVVVRHNQSSSIEESCLMIFVKMVDAPGIFFERSFDIFVVQQARQDLKTDFDRSGRDESARKNHIS